MFCSEKIAFAKITKALGFDCRLNHYKANVLIHNCETYQMAAFSIICKHNTFIDIEVICIFAL